VSSFLDEKMYDKIVRKVIRMNRSQPPKPVVVKMDPAGPSLDEQGQQQEYEEVKIKKENLYL
jgi:hypothetical protein